MADPALSPDHPVFAGLGAAIDPTRPILSAAALMQIRDVAEKYVQWDRGLTGYGPAWVGIRLLGLLGMLREALTERDAAQAAERRTRNMFERAVQRLVAHGLPIADLEAAPDA